MKVAECDEISKEGINFYKEQKKAALEKAKLELQPFAGGGANGSDWAEHLVETPSWEDFELECKQSLMANEFLVTQLPELRKKVLADRAIGLFTNRPSGDIMRPKSPRPYKAL